jgi:hypothetical protein
MGIQNTVLTSVVLQPVSFLRFLVGICAFHLPGTELLKNPIFCYSLLLYNLSSSDGLYLLGCNGGETVKVYQSFWETYYPHLQVKEYKKPGTGRQQGNLLGNLNFPHSLFYYPKDRGNIFLKNIGDLPDYMVSHPRRWYSSLSPLIEHKIYCAFLYLNMFIATVFCSKLGTKQMAY